MGLFGNNTERDALYAKLDGLHDQVKALEAQIVKLTARKDSLAEEAALNEQVVSLHQQISTLEIERDKRQEGFDREKREVEHMVGLERRKAEFEKESGRREAELSVREANLSEERKLFEQKMEFITTNLEGQVSYLKDDIIKALMPAITKAMPNVDMAFGQREREVAAT